MRSTLHIKFIALYIIFGFLCLFSTATLTEQLVTDKLTEDTSHTLYREATFVANDYLPSYFSGDSSIYNVQSQLSAMRLYFNASIWFVDSTGRTLTSSSLEDTVLIGSKTSTLPKSAETAILQVHITDILTKI